ncbi:alkaline phosphatase PhoX [uncultured Marixanthomonas sp.]|uniref:alkaline phosphatase PhoX n=1 Tax=uncultured Marixanthomonas sp. TaxID=757245 RepID=UPI0030DDDB07|tara:strand:+ start:86410 stop:89379 length:2970 start_codon:yes stop_codon:yes gene_type:complete
MKTNLPLVVVLMLLSVLGLANTGDEINTRQSNMVLSGGFPFDAGSTWSYHDTGMDLGTAWREVAYDDSAWATGAAQLGYGDSDEITTLSFGPDANNKYPTYYFRYEFNIVDASIYGDLIFKLLRDDGAVVYLNGTEIIRDNMPSGTITYNTFADSTVGGNDEDTFFNFTVENLLQNGDNVIAVELHQRSGSSSDLGFDMATDFIPAEPSPATYPMEAGLVWSYLDTGVSLDNEIWTEAGYDISTWSAGFAPLGYGDPVATDISFGPDPNNKYITTYFVKEVTITLADLTENVILGLNRDDGAIVYINGVEVIRDNMPGPPTDYLTNAEATVSGEDENAFFTHSIAKSFFIEGINKIAVELHNRDGQSSDLKFDMFINNEATTVPCETGTIGCFTSIEPTGQTPKMIIADDHRFQLIVKQGDPYTTGVGTVGGNNDFTGYIPIEDSSTGGYVAINHETTPGGVTIADVNLNDNTLLWEVTQTQPVDFFNNALVTTTRNCSGGITPWGTIITAEESTNGGDINADGYQDVGWLVEIDPATAEVVDYGNGQEKLWAMGRMKHENVVVSHDLKTAYFGEDGGTDCVYKFVANNPGDLSSGSLYVLKLDSPLVGNDPSSPTATWVQVPNNTTAERNNVTAAAAALGGTDFNGVEDCEINPLTGEIYFTSKGKSRVYSFTDNGSTITNFQTFVGGTSYDITTGSGVFNEAWGGGNDNLTFDDKGNLWVLQDGGNNYIWVVRPDHTQAVPNVELFASMPNGSEPTGLTFTPDFKYGFFSVQHPSGSNEPQQDATFNNITFDASSTIVFALKENLGAQIPVADFVASEVTTTPGNAITFTDLSANNPNSWTWTFEGGIPATSSEASPTVAYLEEGNFNVSLIVANAAGTGTEVTKENYILVQEVLEVDDVLKDVISVYPNPTSGILNVDIANQEGEITVEVFNMLGQNIVTQKDAAILGNKRTVTLNLAPFINANQMLLVKVTVGENSGSYKIIKQN